MQIRSFSARHLTVIAAAALILVALACSSDGDVEDSAAVAKAATPAASPPQPTQAPPTAAPEPTAEPAPTQPPDTPTPKPTELPATPEPEPTPAEIVYPSAPELAETGGWINSDPFTLEAMQGEGKVVLIDFWTYTCINCIRTLPYVSEWHDKYADHGLVILGVHTPEFEFEKDYDNVVEAAGKFSLAYPIVQDNDFGTWRAFKNRYWPAKYLIDHEGRIRYAHFGEGAYNETEMEIRNLLTEAGYDIGHISPDTDPEPIIAKTASDNSEGQGQTRELYAGFERNMGTLMAQGVPPYVAHPEYYEGSDMQVLYTDPGDHLNHFLYLQGLWLNTHESLVHARETMDFEDYIALKFFGTSANVVMSPESTEHYDVMIFLDDAPIPQDRAGKDIMYDPDGNSFVSVDTSRMYFLVDQSEFEGGELRLTSNSPDFQIFAFTFGGYEGGEPGNKS